MNEKQAYFDWAFGLQWLAACAAGMIIFGMIAFYSMWSVAGAVEDTLGETAAWLAAGSVFGALYALGASIGPGLLLRGRGVDAKRWTGYSAIGALIGAALGFVLFGAIFDLETLPESLAGLAIGLSVGLPAGIGQWLALRQSGTAANAWPVIVTMAFVIAFIIGFPLGGEGREWIALSVTGLLTSAITALGMMWLMRQQTVVAA